MKIPKQNQGDNTESPNRKRDQIDFGSTGHIDAQLSSLSEKVARIAADVVNSPALGRIWIGSHNDETGKHYGVFWLPSIPAKQGEIVIIGDKLLGDDPIRIHLREALNILLPMRLKSFGETKVLASNLSEPIKVVSVAEIYNGISHSNLLS
jgi:hypothetical protein